MSRALKEARDAKVTRLGELADLADERSLTAEELEEATQLKSDIADIDARWALADDVKDLRSASREVADDSQDTEVRSAAHQSGDIGLTINVSKDPGHYSERSDNSWVRDRARMQLMGDQDAAKRLHENTKYVIESRALTSTTASSGGELVPPVYLQEMFLEKREKATPILNKVTRMPLPATGASVTVPIQDGSTSAAIQADNASISETDATFTHQTATVYHVAGLQKLPLQLVERSEPGADAVILANLGKQCGLQMAAKAFHGTGSSQPTGITATSGIASVSYTDASPTLAELYPKLADAIQQIHTAYHEAPSDIAMAPRRWGWALAALDSSSRPLITPYAPQNNLATMAGGRQGVGADVGVLQGVNVFSDSNITLTNGASTNEDIIVVGDFSAAFLWTSDMPIFDISRDAGFGTGQVYVRARQYYAFAVGYAGAFAKITGTGLVTPTF